MVIPVSRRLNRQLPISGAFIILAATAAQAALLPFTDRATWLGAVGPLSFTEDFQSYSSDTSFRTAPFLATGFSIQQEGFDAGFRNLVEVPPFPFADNNGTAGLALFVEADRPTTVRFTFTQPNRALGGEATDALNREGVAMDVYNGGTLLGTIPLSDSSHSFSGYLLTDGDVATSVVLRSVMSDNEPLFGEGFGYDNVAGVTVIPEPTTAGLLGAGAMGLLGLARRWTRRGSNLPS